MKPVAKKRKKMFLLVGVGVILAIITAATILTGGTEAETVPVRTGDIIRAVEDTGYVQPATNYDLHAVQNARVVRVPVDTGQQVKKGQTLVVLENLDLSLQIEDTRSQLSQTAASISAAQAAVQRIELELKNAGENLVRFRELYESGAIAVVDVEEARLKVETLEQSLKEQTSLLESARAQEAGLNRSLQNLNRKERQLTLQSPVDGIVLSLPAKQEQVVTPGTVLASVAVPDKLEIKADILSDDLGEVNLGQRVKITAPVLGAKLLYGKVKEIYPLAEEKQSALGVIQRRVPVIVTLADPANLKPGYEVKVAIETSTRQDVLLIPREAVRTLKGGGKEVMVVTGNRVEHRPVQTGIGDRENIEITAGLAAGEVIIRDGNLDLKENTRVKPIEG
ncbi:efflux RND transporter periplasmic adaptor subunit [Desulfotruncus alcoholivorax]|uniref:efflux RND transporter periplasmic adaptor subunit n=1 Tax=Desulfotruncus alcoholivorax TaxID=265477 RepID=UPI000408436C|nr:efflux RND transporter periplasmic adaptor subunit [Desulfotruncus alcoholivorax]